MPPAGFWRFHGNTRRAGRTVICSCPRRRAPRRRRDANLAAPNGQEAPTMPRNFVQLDVFATKPGDGNPLAVVLEADGLADEQMQAIARWTRLPETTFVLPP